MGVRLALAVAAVWTPIVCAQQAHRPVPRPVIRMVEALDSEDLAVRVEATDALVREVLRKSQVDGTTIVRLLGEPGLSPEQRARLIQVDRAAFAHSPRAAMGIQFAATREHGVEIGQTFEKFPSFLVLRPGDVIVSVDGDEIRTQDDLRYAILSHDPGDVLRVRLVRVRMSSIATWSWGCSTISLAERS